MNYILDEIPRGQLNNVILSTMLDGDKYGYEIIEEISKWSNGKIELKQPSLYSALKRLEANEMLSSYWTDSELGGNRHYYRLTDLGRKTAASWAEEFMQSKDTPNVVLNTNPIQEIKQSNQEFTILDQGNMFQLLKEERKEEPKLPVVDDNKLNELQYNLFDKIPVQETVKEQKIQRAARIANLNSKSQLVQLKQFTEMDRKSEFEKIKQNNQNNFFKSEKNEPKIEKKEDFCFIKENYEQKPMQNEEIKKQENTFNFEEKQEEKVESTFNISKYASARDGYFLTPEKVETEKEDKEDTNINSKQEEVFYKNDGVFLNEYETATELPKVKKIEPMSLNIEIPSPNDSISFKNSRTEDLFKTKKEETETKSVQNVQLKRSAQRPTFSSYMGLKNYYNHLGIQFDEYKQENKNIEVDKKHVWLINIIRCSILLFISTVLSFALNFGVKSELYGRITFVIIPCIILLIGLSYSLIYLYEYKHPKSKLPVLNITSTLHSIIISVCLILVTIAINLMLGFNANTGTTYLPTLIYPIIMLSIIAFSVQINKLVEKFLTKLNHKNHQ